MTEETDKTHKPKLWQRLLQLANSRVWWLAPLLLALSILVLGWVVVQTLGYASPFIYEAF